MQTTLQRIDLSGVVPTIPPLPFMDKRGVVNYMSTPFIYGLLSMLTKVTGGPFLEIGSYRGQTLVCVARNNKTAQITGIDNFTKAGYRKTNEGILRGQIEPYKNIRFIKDDFQNLPYHMNENQRVIFVDGPHGFAETMDQLCMATALLDIGGYMVIDDMNFREVFRAFEVFVKAHEKEYDVILMNRRPHSPGANHPQWWNGIAIIQKKQSHNDRSEEE